MIHVTDETFQELIDKALQSLPGEHVKQIKNVAILYENEPTAEQRANTNLRPDQTLLGLYEGVPLSQRNGSDRIYPDKITLFRTPLSSRADSEQELQEAIRHTLWHEIAHYYGLDHDKIHALE